MRLATLALRIHTDQEEEGEHVTELSGLSCGLRSATVLCSDGHRTTLCQPWPALASLGQRLACPYSAKCDHSVDIPSLAYKPQPQSIRQCFHRPRANCSTASSSRLCSLDGDRSTTASAHFCHEHHDAVLTNAPTFTVRQARYAPKVDLEASPSSLLGLRLASAVTAPEAVPSFPASIMDGYAVVAADGPGMCVTSELPSLDVVDESARASPGLQRR